jgi:uncharacterized membrane protein
MPTAKPPGLEPNMAGVLSYLLMLIFLGLPIPGIIMLVIEKSDRFVRFHAWQSIALGVVMCGGMIVLGVIANLAESIFSVFGTLVRLIRFLAVCGGLWVWVLVMVHAYNMEAWHIPYLGDWAARQSGITKGGHSPDVIR